MKKRILSIILALCMVAAMVPAIQTTASAADTCTCVIKCKVNSLNADCPVCSKSGATVDDCHGRISWTEAGGSPITTYEQLDALMGVTSLTNVYYFPLEADITVLGGLEAPQSADLVIDLNGHCLTGSLRATGIFSVEGRLTIIDTVGTGKLTGGSDGGAFLINNGGYVLMQGGTIEECRSSYYGGVNVLSGGTFEMTGGTIQNNYHLVGTTVAPVRNISAIGNSTVIISGNAQVLYTGNNESGFDSSVLIGGTGGDIPTLYIDGGKIEGYIRIEDGGTITATRPEAGTVITTAMVENKGGTISAGTYQGEVENKEGGTINGGSFAGKVTNTGSISGGTFASEVDNQGTISGGTYSETSVVQNTGTISGGAFASEVDNQGTISGGSFAGKVTNTGSISGGTFASEVDNQGTISDGTYSETGVVKNTGTISGGTFLGTVETENGTVEDSAMVSVNFVNEAGETMKTVRVLRGQRITSADLPEFDPTQYGYKKLKYTVGNTDYRDEDKFINEVHFTEDETWVTVTRISPIAYTITCDLNGGMGQKTYTYTVTDPDFTLLKPTKEGYIFMGWSRTDLQEDYSMALTVTIPQGSIGNRTYTANYRKDWSGEIIVPTIGYTVVFDTQGGSPVDTKTYNLSISGSTDSDPTKPVLEDVSTTRAGYKLQLWTCGGRPVNLDATVSDLKQHAVNGVITLKASWRAKQTIEFGIKPQKYTYDGEEKAVEIVGTTLDGFHVTYRQDGHTVEAPVNAGSYDVTITREEDTAFQAVNMTVPGGLVIHPKAVEATISQIPDQTYTGNDMKPAVKVWDGDVTISGVQRIPASEYTVDYANNRNAGTATVTVTAKAGGNYTFPQITQSFTIKQKSINPAVTMADYVYGTDPGYPKVSGNESGGTVSVYYSTYDDIADNTAHRVLWDENFTATTLNAGTYYMMAQVAETQNYTSGISPVISFKVMVNQYAAPAVPTLGGSTVTVSEADRSKALEYSVSGGEWVDVPPLNNGSFVPAGLADHTGYTLSLRVKASADGNYGASDAVDCFFVAYNANGGTGTVSGASASSGNAVTVASGDRLGRDGYTFGGWNTESDGTGTAYAPGSSVTTGATLYAQWTANRYTVTFDTVGGTEIASKTTVQWTDAVLDGVPEPTRDGWKFIGWKYGDVTVTPQTTYRELAAEDTVTSVTLVAQWKDMEKPVITGLENNKTYCAAVAFEVSDNDGIASVQAGNQVLTVGSNGKYTLDAGVGKVTVVVTDKAGNETSVTVTVNNDHTYEWKSENGQYWKKCKYCGYETAKKEIPTITIDGADGVCVTQDYKFSFTLPEGATDAVYGYEFENKGELGLPAVMENNEPHGVVSSQWYEPSENSFQVYAGATTADGFEFFVSKTVALKSEHTDTAPKDHICDVCGKTLSDHTGGEAACTSKAICEYCGEEYGELDSTNHDLEKVPAKDATVTETGNTEHWHCLDCGKYFADENGENEIALNDTVIPKLPPEVIEGEGQSVTAGEEKDLSFTSDAAFSDFIRVELDGKTLEEKHYTVKEGSTVVTLKADYVANLSVGEHTIGIVSASGTAATAFTVHAKPAVPPTGDNSMMWLWVALLLVSGSLLTVTAVSRKRKMN